MQINTHVTWGRGMSVQIGVTPTQEHTTCSSTDEPLIESTGFYADLNRAQINRLIKVLRTARDQAYGRDE